MKIFQINTVYGEGSTGKIVKEIHDACTAEEIECLSAYRCNEKGKEIFEDGIPISSFLDSRLHGRLANITMLKGFFSVLKTTAFIKKVKKYSPDVIHLHNLHGSYVNIPILFRYIEKNNIPVVWTMHDCWPFTAICSHFDLVGCKKWKSGCGNCPQKKKYSSCPVDFTEFVWKSKKKYFSLPTNMTIAAPSDWLCNLIKESFFGKYPVTTVYNGIDLDVFKPISSEFRKIYGLEDKRIVLGVAFDWGYGKGLDVFVNLSENLPEDYKIVLVGTNDDIDKVLPENILSIHRTNSREELAGIYSAADVFVNPTREEVLGLTNIEALACGTPVITFKTGGSPECIDNTCGVAVEKDDTDTVKAEIMKTCSAKTYSEEDCIYRAKMFDKNNMINEYINIYKYMAEKKHSS